MTESFTLYDKQAEVVSEIDALLNEENNLADNHVYLSGEMGSGKTYMGSKLVNDYIKRGYHGIVISPKVNINKWHDLLNKSNIVKRKEPFTHPGSIYDTTLMAFEDLNTWLNKNPNGLPSMDKVFLIVDEIHLANRSKLNAFQTLFKNIKKNGELLKTKRTEDGKMAEFYVPNPDYDFKGVYLTGTIMEGEKSNLDAIISTTHKENTRQYDIEHQLRTNFPRFVYDIWSHISVAISLEDVQALEENREEIKQEVAPINAIDFNQEQQLFHDVIHQSLRDLGVKRADSLSVSYIDNPNKDLLFKQNSRTSKTRIKGGQYTRLALPLSSIDFKKTSKYLKLKQMIEESEDDKILIYVNEKELIDELCHHLNSDGVSAFKLNNVKRENYSEYINTMFDSHKVGVVNPEHVNVGVDIHAEQLVWYQLMPQLDKMIQAQRRVCRLSSENNSLVTLFIYNTPYEQERAMELSNAVKNNAVTYGVKQDDPLAQLTGVILEGVN